MPSAHLIDHVIPVEPDTFFELIRAWIRANRSPCRVIAALLTVLVLFCGTDLIRGFLLN